MKANYIMRMCRDDSMSRMDNNCNDEANIMLFITPHFLHIELVGDWEIPLPLRPVKDECQNPTLCKTVRFRGFFRFSFRGRLASHPTS
jgi:hypothetical protein